MQLRPYQAECVQRAIEALERGKKSLIVMPTGCGKTVVFSHITEHFRQRRTKTLIIAHRRELIFQAVGTLSKVLDVEPHEIGVEMAEESIRGRHINSLVCVASIQSLVNRLDNYTFDPDQWGVVIIDEAHHATATTYTRVIDHFSESHILGVTATPDRADEEKLGQVFDEVVYDYSLCHAIDDGWLVGIDQQMVRVDAIDFSGVTTPKDTDFSDAQVEQVMRSEESLHGVAKPIVDLSGDMPTLVFSASVQHASDLAAILNRYKPDSARMIDGTTPDDQRANTLADYHAGRFQYLCNCGVFLEGFDEPRISCVAMARPTKSRSLYAQAVGRGTRPLPGVLANIPHLMGEDGAEVRREAIACSAKPAVLVLDFVGNAGRHKLVHAADILGDEIDDEVIEEANAMAARNAALGQVTNVAESIRLAEEVVQERREAAARRELELAAMQERRKHIKASHVDYRTTSVNPFVVFDLPPCREPAWHRGRELSEKQLAVLQRAGIDAEGIGFSRASRLIEELKRRRAADLCTYKQAKTLLRYGLETNVTFRQASRLIDAIAANRWKPISSVEVRGILSESQHADSY